MKEKECCGECVRKRCTFGNKIYNIGDRWESRGNCRTYECAKTSNGNKVEVNIFSNQISCPNIGNCSKNRVQYEDCCPHCDDGTSSDSTNKRNILRINENHDTLISRDTYINHPCRRECVKSYTKTCTYKFVVSVLMHHNRITTTYRPKFISP